MLAARAILREIFLMFGGVGIFYSPNIFRSEQNINYIRARILRQSKLNEYQIIGSMVCDDRRSEAGNLFAHAISGWWSFGLSKLDLKQSSFRRDRSSIL